MQRNGGSFRGSSSLVESCWTGRDSHPWSSPRRQLFPCESGLWWPLPAARPCAQMPNAGTFSSRRAAGGSAGAALMEGTLNQ